MNVRRNHGGNKERRIANVALSCEETSQHFAASGSGFGGGGVGSRKEGHQLWTGCCVSSELFFCSFWQGNLRIQEEVVLFSVCVDFHSAVSL